MPLLYETIQYQREECLEITGFQGTLKSLTIPDRIGGLYVRSIAKHAFARRTDLVEVSLPDSIKRLSLFAFHNCTNLKIRVYLSLFQFTSYIEPVKRSGADDYSVLKFQANMRS